MKLPALAMFLACANASVAAEPPRGPPPAHQVPYAFIAFKPDISDYYPAVSRALGEQGTASLVICYDRDGKPDEVAIVDSSGIPRIDDAAVRWGKAVRIKPATMNGASKADCTWVRAKFSLAQSQESQEQGDALLPAPAIIWPSAPPPASPGRFIPLGGEAQ